MVNKDKTRKTDKSTDKNQDKGRKKKMPLKIIGYIIIMIIVAIFFGINGTNSCDINLLFKEFSDVPVITTILISFAAGIFVMLPFTFGRKKKKNPVQETASSVDSKTKEKASKKPAKKATRFEQGKKKDTKSDISTEDENPTVINLGSSADGKENDKPE